MNKNTLITSIILAMICITIILILTFPSITSLYLSSDKVINIKASTKAICDENNLCQDHLIECENKKVRKISPITGAVVQFDKEWQDPRTKEQKEFC